MDEDDEIEGEVIVQRSLVDPSAWVAIPYGIAVDQSFAQNCGRLHLVKAWAAMEYASGCAVRWERIDRDRYRMVLT